MSGERYTFEQWTLDCGRGALTGADGEIALRPKTYEVLRFLVANAGRLVSRDEILDAVWRNVTVTEESLVDADNAVICAKLAFCYVRAYHDPSDPELGNPSLLKHGCDLAVRAVGLDPNLPLARANLGWALLWMRQHDAAISEYEKAFALNPNFSDPLFGGVLAYAGEASRALGFAQAHLRLDPFHPPHIHAIQGHALYMLRRYREAIPPLRECIRRSAANMLGLYWLATTLVRLGEGEEARAVAAELLRRRPRITHWLALAPYRSPQDAEHMNEAVREAGIS
jgi:tetratricopeptide (TPR) repeat protein